MDQDRCCLCFSVKTGVWIIGALEIISMVEDIYNGLVYKMIAQFLLSLIITAIFCVLFLFMMVSPTGDTYKLRNSVFFYYLIALTIIPVVITLMGIFGIGFDIVTPICNEIKEQVKKKDESQSVDNCKPWTQAGLGFFILFFTMIRLYFSYILKKYAD